MRGRVRAWGCGMALIAIAVACVASSQARAGSIPYPHTDIEFIFDTSGSMEGALGEAKAEIQTAMAQIAGQLPDVQFGVSQVRDYGGSVYDEENEDDKPWELRVVMTPDQAVVTAGINLLQADGGGDPPESYGRALWEADTNPTVGWRPGARHLIVLIADNVPHDAELNEGIPSNVWYEDSPWDTGEEIDEAAGVPVTQLSAATNLDWQSVLQQLAADGKPLEFVDYQGEVGLLPYWENWAVRTGGRAALADSGQLVAQVVGLAAAGGTAGVCAPVRGSVGKRLLASLKCTAAMTWLEGECGVELTLNKALKALSVTKGLIELKKVRKGWRPLAKLVNDFKRAKFRKNAPRGFRSPPEILEKLSKVKDGLELVKLLRDVAKALAPEDFRQIALDIGDLAGAKACVEGLLLAVE